MMTDDRHRFIHARARAILAAVALSAGLAVIAGSGLAGPGPRVLADCDNTVDTTDSFSMDCAPTMIPDMSDQLTEAEVAEPGWNARPGGGVDGGGGGRR